MIAFACECNESGVCMCEELGECVCDDCFCDQCSQQISYDGCGCGGNCQCGAYEE